MQDRLRRQDERPLCASTKSKSKLNAETQSQGDAERIINNYTSTSTLNTFS
jgi:hypothetical protein